MLIKTRHFGEVELDENKIIHFDNGLLGFEGFQDYTLLYDNSEGQRPIVSWLQNIEEPSLALPVMSPFLLKEDYNPEVEDELLIPLGELTDENIMVLVTITVPAKVEDMTANLKAPLIINSDTRKGCQVVAQNPEYEIRYRFYPQLKALKEAKGAGKC